MTLNGLTVTGHERSECFAHFFEQKVKSITENTHVNHGVFNGVRKIVADDQMFMSRPKIMNCITSIELINPVQDSLQKLFFPFLEKKPSLTHI